MFKYIFASVLVGVSVYAATFLSSPSSDSNERVKVDQFWSDDNSVYYSAEELTTIAPDSYSPPALLPPNYSIDPSLADDAILL